jgi:photosystem II stability/assembly factor-like uncharacterized protein
MAATSKTMIVGTRKGLFVLKNGKGGWKVSTYAHSASPVPYACVDPRHGTLWASIDHGHWGCKLHRSSDLGKTWEEVEAPKYPKSARVKSWSDTKAVAATLRYIWVITPGGADEPERMYLGTEPGGLFRSDDGGETFQLVKALWNHPSRATQWFGGGRDFPGIHSILVDPRDSRRVLVGVSCAGVFETTDGGKTWEPRNKGLTADFLPDPDAEIGQDPHFVDFSPANPDHLWMQNHCGIFRSTNGAKSWKQVSKVGQLPHFGFAVSVDEKNPDVAWVVPAVSDTHRIAVDGKMSVCRTTDGGKTWRALRRGLPQKNCYDITFRHALDNTNGSLAFGTTTGNLYFSEDRGQSWEDVSNNLPPIYSVRFAQ